MTWRHDRAPKHARQLAAPVQRDGYVEFEGVAARLHGPGDGLAYPEFKRTEYRDASELRAIVEQLPGKPVVVNHPQGGKMKASTPIIGRVASARIDGDLAIVKLHIDTNEARGLVAVGLDELSLGYDVGLDSRNYQRETEVDHLAFVPIGRCGGACTIRTDEKSACTCHATESMSHNPHKDHPMPDKTPQMNQDEALRSLETQRADAAARATAAEALVASEKARADQASGRIQDLETQISDLKVQIAAGATAAESESIARETVRADAAEAQIAQFEAKFDARVNERVALVTRAGAVMGPDFRCDGFDNREIMAAVVKRLDPNADVSASVSTDLIRGRFDSATERHASTARSMARIAEVTAQTTRTDSKVDAETKRRNQWKQPLPSTQLKTSKA